MVSTTLDIADSIRGDLRGSNAPAIYNLNILCWNYRGLRSNLAINCVNDVSRWHKLDCIILTETMLSGGEY